MLLGGCAGLYVPDTVKCNTQALTAFLNRTIEDPPRLVAGFWEERFRPVAVLQPGARCVFDQEIPGRSFTLKDSVSGLQPPRLPARWFHDAMRCPR